MNWLDIILLLLVVGVAVLEAFRGFGRAIFDALGLFAALWLAGALSPGLAPHMPLHTGAGADHSHAFSLLFVLLSLLCLGVSRFVHGMTLIHTGMFEALLGLTAGVAVGMVAAHAVTCALVMADPGGRHGAALVAGGAISSEAFSFTTYHSVMDTLTGATTYRRSLPNVAGN